MIPIGLIGGMSWESTVPYYRALNEGVRARLGGLHSARVLLWSVDFHDIEILQREDRWEAAGRMLADAGAALERAGAGCLVLATNTMHKVAPAIEAAITIPFLHIADPTADAVKRAGVATVGLLGTRFTMEQDFYAGRLRDRHGLAVVVPEANDRAEVHRIIYEELCLGRLVDASRERYRAVVARLAARGATGVILGCTEIAMLLAGHEMPLPTFDTTTLHAEAAVEFAVGQPASGV